MKYCLFILPLLWLGQYKKTLCTGQTSLYIGKDTYGSGNMNQWQDSCKCCVTTFVLDIPTMGFRRTGDTSHAKPFHALYRNITQHQFDSLVKVKLAVLKIKP